MRSLHAFIIEPENQRYNNTKKIDQIDLILNTDLQDHKFVSRVGKVISTPTIGKTGIKQGDKVLVHHNVFRRFHDVRGEEKNSKSFFEEDKYFVFPEQIFMYKRESKWMPLEGFCFVQPIENKNIFSNNQEQELTGIIKYLDNGLIKNGIKEGDLIGFTPDSEYEFIVENKRLYRVPTNSICIKYEYQGTEKEYHPIWLQGS